MKRRIQSFVWIVVALALGNSLLTWYLVHVLGNEATKQMADLRQHQENEIIAEVRGRVETVCLMIRHIEETTEDAAQAQKVAMDEAAKIRFGENNYVWIHRLDPRNLGSAFMLVHPADELRGRDNAGLIDLDRITQVYHEGEIVPKTDPRVRYLKPVDLFTEFNRIALSQGEGIVSYYWPKVIDGRSSPEGYRKVAFVKYLPEWNWVVGAGAYADHIDIAMKERARQLARHNRVLAWRVAGAMAGFSLVIVLVVSFLSWRVARRQIDELRNEVEERRRAEGALRESEERYKTLFESASDAIMTLDVSTFRFSSCNSATLAMFGAKDQASFVSKYPWELSTDDQTDGRPSEAKSKEMLAIAMRQGSHSFEWMHKRLDGEEFPAAVTLTRMEIAGKTLVLAVVRDITEHKRMQEQLAQAQRMESIGRLAGGVAHDFNNLLAVILGYGEMLDADLPQDSPFREEIRQITAAGRRAKDLTQQLLAFSRKQVLEMKAVDVNALIGGMEMMLRRLLGEDIEMKVVLDPSPGSVKADPAQLEQVFMNLCVNARDAMPNGGVLTIETGSALLDSEYTRTRPNMRPGRYVVFGVSDTGCGMDAETRRQIFDPFFTTKGKERGTGLGLATVYGIVRQHGGDIIVYSEQGRGSTFKVYLPAVQSVSAERDTGPLEETVHGKGETILVLEDDPNVRQLTVQMVSRLGYSVIEASDAEECFRLAQSAEPIDLLLTDVIMPGLNGRQVCDRLSKIRHGLRTLFMSGYTEDAIAQHGVLEDGVHLITKPFTATDLGRKIREALTA